MQGGDFGPLIQVIGDSSPAMIRSGAVIHYSRSLIANHRPLIANRKPGNRNLHLAAICDYPLIGLGLVNDPLFPGWVIRDQQDSD